MRVYRVADAAKFLGVTAKTMRRWDDKGVLKPAARSAGGQRLYTEVQLLGHRDRGKGAEPSTGTDLTLASPVPEKAGQSEKARQHIRDMDKARREVWNRCIRGGRPWGASNALIDEKGEKLKTDLFKSNVVDNCVWAMPPRDELMNEANIELKKAMAAYDESNWPGAASELINVWVYHTEGYGRDSKPDLQDAFYPPLPLMIAKGRGVECIEIRLWFERYIARRREGKAVDFFTREEVCIRPYGHKPIESDWIELYLKRAYAWRIRDLMKRKL
jgi:DNA-binding transcriptional MerR regulator